LGCVERNKEQVRIYEGNLKYMFCLLAYGPGETSVRFGCTCMKFVKATSP